MAMFEYDENGIYRCVNCGKGLSPGHNIRCKQKAGDIPHRRRRLNDGHRIEVGMKMLHASEENNEFDITQYVKRGQ